MIPYARWKNIMRFPDTFESYYKYAVDVLNAKYFKNPESFKYGKSTHDMDREVFEIMCDLARHGNW